MEVFCVFVSFDYSLVFGNLLVCVMLFVEWSEGVDVGYV